MGPFEELISAINEMNDKLDRLCEKESKPKPEMKVLSPAEVEEITPFSASTIRRRIKDKTDCKLS